LSSPVSLGCASAYNIFAKHCQQQNTQHKICQIVFWLMCQNEHFVLACSASAAPRLIIFLPNIVNNKTHNIKYAKLLEKRGNRMQKYFAKKNIFLCGKM
jgi:hypothetical protein